MIHHVIGREEIKGIHIPVELNLALGFDAIGEMQDGDVLIGRLTPGNDGVFEHQRREAEVIEYLNFQRQNHLVVEVDIEARP